jgi:hypothetical protein
MRLRRMLTHNRPKEPPQFAGCMGRLCKETILIVHKLCQLWARLFALIGFRH